MIIIHDQVQTILQIKALFAPAFFARSASSLQEAAVFLHQYDTPLLVILLSLDMTGAIKFLECIRQNENLQAAPIIALIRFGESGTRFLSLKAGADEFTSEPIREDEIRLRVELAVARSRNSFLRIQGSFLQTQKSEIEKYRMILQSTGTAVRVASLDARLKTLSHTQHWYNMSAFKHSNQFSVANQIILTFTDKNAAAIIEEQLRYQAEHDELTGLLNRRTFLRKSEELVKQAPPASYMLLCGDIDNSRYFNERFGRDAGGRLLQDVPVDVIKLDMRFFAGKNNPGRGAIIISSVITMARWLDIPAIAEGVGTVEQADFLLSIGCRTIQRISVWETRAGTGV